MSALVRYRVIDQGTQGNDNLGCAMSVNDRGWTEIMAGMFTPALRDFVPAKPLHGRVLIDVDGFKADLRTLGGPDSWMMWGEINDSGQVVGFSETAVPDPNGEDVCGLGTNLTCRPFLWQPFNTSTLPKLDKMGAPPTLGKMSSLPTLGGNNGQASAINNRGQISGMAFVLSGPDAGKIHAFLATPVRESAAESISEAAPACQKSILSVGASKQLLHGFEPGRFQR